MHRMNVRMVDHAVETITQVDVLVVVLDATLRTGKGDRFVLDLLDGAAAPVIPGAQQDRPDGEAQAAPAHGTGTAGSGTSPAWSRSRP